MLNKFFAHFDIENLINVEETVYKLNALLPKDIAVYTIFRVSNESHARFNATSRSYVYRLSPKKDAFNTGFAYYFKPKLDVNAMNKAAELLIGFKDFECFSKSNTDVFTYNCDLRIAEWKIYR